MATTKRRVAPVRVPQLPPELSQLEELELEEETAYEGLLVTGADAVVPSAELAHVEIARSRLVGARLTAAVFDHLRLVDVVIEDCDLSGVSLSHTRLERVELNRCRMSGLAAPELKAEDVRFVQCKLDDAWFRMAALERCEFVDCDLRGADFYGSKLAQTRFLQSDLTRVELAQAKLDAVALHGSTLDNLKGADGLRGAVISSDQLVSLALPVFAALGIKIDDDYFAEPNERA